MSVGKIQELVFQETEKRLSFRGQFTILHNYNKQEARYEYISH
jgi:hypothetical protein